MFEFILYVKDQQVSRDFYSKVLKKEPSLDVPGMTEFTLAENVKLGLMPENGIARILTNLPHPSRGEGIPRCELYLSSENPAVDYNLAVNVGAISVSVAADRDWGDHVSYVSDPDGHIIAFAKKII